MNEQISLQTVDAADVTIVVDNFVDGLLPSTEIAIRAPLSSDQFEREQLIAEHGFSLLLTVRRDDRRETILYDAGLGRNTAIHNMDVLGINVADIRTMVLSHGHADHHLGLEGLFQRVGKRGMVLVLHPDAWLERKTVFSTGLELEMPPPSRNDLDREGWQVIEARAPSLLLDGMVLVTGQVERVTDFEKGLARQYMQTKEGWEKDPWTRDDQAIVCHVKNKGLVVLSSCSHAGVINILRYAQRLTGIERIYAFVGGMHLTGGAYESIIPRTVDELATINPAIMVPAHCTGWKATNELIRRFPAAYIQPSVGTRLHFA